MNAVRSDQLFNRQRTASGNLGISNIANGASAFVVCLLLTVISIIHINIYMCIICINNYIFTAFLYLFQSIQDLQIFDSEVKVDLETSGLNMQTLLEKPLLLEPTWFLKERTPISILLEVGLP